MSSTKRQSPKQLEAQEAEERLREWLQPGDTVYTVLRHTSRSKAVHVVQLLVLRAIPDSAGDLSERGPFRRIYLGGNCHLAFGWSYDRQRDGIVTDVGGMDFGFDLVYNLSYKLFDRNGDALRHEWI